MTDEARDEQSWDVGWEGHEAAQRQRLARLPFREKPRWLEEAQRVLLQLRKQQAQPGDAKPDER